MTSKPILLVLIFGIAFSILSYFWLDESFAELSMVHKADHVATWELITELGNWTWMLVLIISIWLAAFSFSKLHPDNPAWKARKAQAVIVFFALATPGVFVLLIKGIIGRARPYMVEDGAAMFFNPFSFELDFSSWPSGHTSTAFAFAMMVGLLYPHTRWVLFPLAAITGYSRMALGVHYLGDVVMGLIIGTVGAMIVYKWVAPKLGIK